MVTRVSLHERETGKYEERLVTLSMAEIWRRIEGRR